MALYKYPGSSRQPASVPVGITEFEILKASHKFLRDEDERPTTWDDKLAGKYYSSLYREFAVCDLKHYKSGNFALRWRTEEEVLDGSGETTCGNTRCEHHFPSRSAKDGKDEQLTTLELPFTYVEQGESKSALVKVVLCRKCVKKLMWKRTKEKEREVGKEKEKGRDEEGEKGEERAQEVKPTERKKKRSREEEEEGGDRDHEARSSCRRRQSRSKSPRRPRDDSNRAR